MESGVRAVDFVYAGHPVISFQGPSDDGPSNIILPLTRPIQFDAIGCGSDNSPNQIFVSWAGNS